MTSTRAPGSTTGPFAGARRAARYLEADTSAAPTAPTAPTAPPAAVDGPYDQLAAGQAPAGQGEAVAARQLRRIDLSDQVTQVLPAAPVDAPAAPPSATPALSAPGPAGQDESGNGGDWHVQVAPEPSVETPATGLPDGALPGGGGPRTSLLVAPAAAVRPAQWGWKGTVHRLTGGLVKPAPDPEELAHREAIATIRQATWTRAVNVIVTNPKGGSGKTPTALLLAGILGHVRGGYVVAWEAAESAGSLARRAEGEPAQGLAELLGSVDSVRSAGNLGGYTAPQTSHADVIGSVGRRAVLSAADVLAARQVLDTYYRVTVTDTGNNPQHQAYLAALHTADAAVLPCLVSIDALAGLEESLAVMHAAGGRVAAPGGLLSRVVVVLGHDGGPEDTRIARALRARLDELGVHAVVEVPFDPAIRLGGAITLADLSEPSTRAWTAAAAAVVRALQSAPTHLDLVRELQAPSAGTPA